MTNEELKKLLALLGLLALAGCGGGAGSTNDSATGSASLAVTISGAKSFNPSIEHGKVKTYLVTIEGVDIAEPIIAEFPGDADGGLIEGVPAGSDRKISVEAINANDLAIRAGDAQGVEISGGENTVDVSLDAVPIFTNLADKSFVDNTRLIFRIFSDPDHPVEIKDAAEANSALADASTNVTDIWVDKSTGLGRLSPALMAPGEHAFMVSDPSTGRSSTVNVTLLDGTKRRPAPLAAAARSDETGTGRIGN